MLLQAVVFVSVGQWCHHSSLAAVVDFFDLNSFSLNCSGHRNWLVVVRSLFQFTIKWVVVLSVSRCCHLIGGYEGPGVFIPGWSL